MVQIVDTADDFSFLFSPILPEVDFSDGHVEQVRDVTIDD